MPRLERKQVDRRKDSIRVLGMYIALYMWKIYKLSAERASVAVNISKRFVNQQNCSNLFFLLRIWRAYCTAGSNIRKILPIISMHDIFVMKSSTFSWRSLGNPFTRSMVPRRAVIVSSIRVDETCARPSCCTVLGKWRALRIIVSQFALSCPSITSTSPLTKTNWELVRIWEPEYGYQTRLFWCTIPGSAHNARCGLWSYL